MSQAAATTYAIECDGGKFYVGKTRKAVQRRFQEHVEGGSLASVWTKMHKPLRVIEESTVVSEDDMVIKMMQLHGVDNVRGGCYSNTELSDQQREAIRRAICSKLDQCFKCNQKGHFVRDCPKTGARRFSQFGTPEKQPAPRAAKMRRISSSDSSASAASSAPSQSPQRRRRIPRPPRPGDANTAAVIVLFCSRCGRDSHTSDECYARSDVFDTYDEPSPGFDDLLCDRCGRNNHTSEDCYAWSDVSGHRLDAADATDTDTNGIIVRDNDSDGGREDVDSDSDDMSEDDDEDDDDGDDFDFL
eukprot:m.44002 g.44002  ORF g.44002 m.44002 type:complete len:302 (+) comp6182_c0_seq1:138-1043(+)